MPEFYDHQELDSEWATHTVPTSDRNDPDSILHEQWNPIATEDDGDCGDDGIDALASLDWQLRGHPMGRGWKMTETKALSKEQIDILHHSIGMKRRNYRRGLAWWLNGENHRNRFCVPATGVTRDMITVNELIILGFMKAGVFINDKRDRYCHVTEAGIREAKKHRPEW